MSKILDEKAITEYHKPIAINLKVDTAYEKKLYSGKSLKYKCCSCNKSYGKQQGNFTKSQSRLFENNGYFIPMCNECRDSYYNTLVKLYSGNEVHAIHHFCRQFDIYFDIKCVQLCISTKYKNCRLSTYMSRINMHQFTIVGKTYLDTIRNDFASAENLKLINEEQVVESGISKNSTNRWGLGLSEWDYITLDEHYKMLIKNNPNCDSNQEIFIKDLCNLNWLMQKALRTQNGEDRYIKLSSQYSKTFKEAGLRTIAEKDTSNDETFGVTLATISQFTPEEYYKNKELFKDEDNIGEYYDRHICRPMKNLQFGTDERDFEFFVPDNEDNEVDD